jgi:hypothetical protein
MIISAKLHSNLGIISLFMTAIGFPRVQIVFYKLWKKQKDTFKTVESTSYFCRYLDTGIIYLKIHPAHLYKSYTIQMMSLMVNYCDGFKVKSKLTVLLQYFYYLYLALIYL